jgi:hypothetical protein
MNRRTAAQVIGMSCILLVSLNGSTWGAPAVQAPATNLPTAPTALQSLLSAYQAEQQVLNKQRSTLVAQGATQLELQAWAEQNAARLAVQAQRAQAMTVISALQLHPTNLKPNLPKDASPTLVAFLSKQAALANLRAQLHNQLVQQAQASGKSLNFALVSQLTKEESQLFQQQNAADLALQAQRLTTLAAGGSRPAHQFLGPSVLPPDTPPSVAAYLTTRNQLLREQIQLSNQYASADAATREAAMEKWREANASLIALLQQQAQSIGKANPTTPNQ